MSTYKKHSCRKVTKTKEDTSWEENILVIVFFLLLVSLSLLIG